MNIEDCNKNSKRNGNKIWKWVDNLGPIDFQGKDQNEYLIFGENIGDKIGAEVKSLIDIAYNDAQKLLIEHRDKLDIIAQTLLQKEKINEQEFNKIFEN